MADFDYVNMRDNVATNLLTQFGSSLEIVSEGKGTFNEDSGKMEGTSSESVQTTVGVVQEFTRFELSSGDVQRDDLKVLVAATALTEEITTTHKLRMNGKLYTIIDVVAINPTGALTVMYECQVRQ